MTTLLERRGMDVVSLDVIIKVLNRNTEYNDMVNISVPDKRDSMTHFARDRTYKNNAYC